MNEHLDFKQKLSEVLECARKNGDRITTEEAEKIFENENLSDEQMALVFDYLHSQKIIVKGYEKKGGVIRETQEISMQPEEEEYLARYMQDVFLLQPEKVGEKEALFVRLKDGDESAKERLLQLYMGKVADIAKELYDSEIFFGDLVQEGNMNLLLALENLDDVENADEAICMEIRQGILAFIDEQAETGKKERKMVQKVKELDEAITKLTDELGRKVMIDELTEEMNLTEREIKDIMRLTGEEPEEE